MVNSSEEKTTMNKKIYHILGVIFLVVNLIVNFAFFYTMLVLASGACTHGLIYSLFFVCIAGLALLFSFFTFNKKENVGKLFVLILSLILLAILYYSYFVIIKTDSCDIAPVIFYFIGAHVLLFLGMYLVFIASGNTNVLLKRILLFIALVVLVGDLFYGGPYVFDWFNTRIEIKGVSQRISIDGTQQTKFISKNLGFSIIYPDNLYIIKRSFNVSLHSKNKVVSDPWYPTPTYEGQTRDASFVINRIQGKSVQDYIDKENQGNQFKTLVTDCRERILNNIKWQECEGNYRDSQKILITHNAGYLYVVSITYGIDSLGINDNYEAIGEDMYKVLETFEFVD